LTSVPVGDSVPAMNAVTPSKLHQKELRHLSHMPTLWNRWVAIRPGSNVVVDTDAELDELCARIDAARKTSLAILFVPSA
jgi:hypothetical protein